MLVIVVCALSIIAIPLFFVLRAIVMQRAQRDVMRAEDARRVLEIAGVAILILGFADALFALPHAHVSAATTPLVHTVVLPLAYITIAVGAATRILSARIA